MYTCAQITVPSINLCHVYSRVGSISIKDILEIHKRVLGHVDPVESGSFRRTQVYVGGHVPPGPGDIHMLMEQFSLWLNSERAVRMHPVR